MKGQTATAREIKARWAYSEVLSDRFGGPYSLILDRPLLDAEFAALLRQCVAETPGMKLVEANDYLPR